MIATAQMLATGSTPRTAAAAPPAAWRAAAPIPLREPLTPDELIDVLNHLLASRPECEGLSVEARDLVPGPPDSHGCNWTPDRLRLNVPRGCSTRALSGVRQVVEWARVRYELAEADQAPRCG